MTRGDDDATERNCPLCDRPEGECDHLVAALDLTYSEVAAGAAFAHERELLDLVEHLAGCDPEAIKVAGGGAELEYLASLVRAEVRQSTSVGDAISIHYPEVIAALSHVLQDDGEVVTTTADSDSEEDSSMEYLWAKDPEPVVLRLVERLRELADTVEDA
ncbi:MAG TPA: hypothetical protein VFV71_00645 [Burkholderiales bacterium]|nr:hypothetical protein [Burkholderiales bacterium]